MSDPFQYSGDDVMCNALGEALKHARLEAGLSIHGAEERLRVAMKQLDHKGISRALGLAIKEARETRQISRKELSRSAGLPLRRLIVLERGLAADLPITEFFRVWYALRMRPDQLTERYEEIEKNIARGAVDGGRVRELERTNHQAKAIQRGGNDESCDDETSDHI